MSSSDNCSPMLRITVPSSCTLMVPLPSVSMEEKAVRYSARTHDSHVTGRIVKMASFH